MLVTTVVGTAAVVLSTTPAAADALIEAESMVLTPGAGTTLGDANASGGRALLVWSNATASGDFTAAATKQLVVRARGDQCSGAPRMDVRAGGTLILSTEVRSTTWRDYAAVVSLPSGTHRVSVQYPNDHRTKKCDRNLRLDRIVVVADTASTTTTTTTAPPTTTTTTTTTTTIPVTTTTTTTTTVPTTTTTTVPTTTTTTVPVTTTTTAPPPSTPSGLAGASLFVDPYSNAAKEAAKLRSSDPARASLFDKIAGQSQADWIGDWVPTSDLAARVRSRVDTITAAGAVPVLVTYAIPVRDCGSYSAGGIGTPEGYRAWIQEFAKGLAGRRSAVVVEPDALAGLSCLTAEQQKTRLALLADAVSTLAAAGASVYLDAGHSSWVPVDTMASRLQSAGITGARGFSLNVSNFMRTADEVAYGKALSSRVGGKAFVIDTSRNGLGPDSGPEAWCNPPGRALGERPTTSTGVAGVDAMLWVKRPGESDGTCKGGPSAGTWWPDYAAGLAERAAWG